MTFHINPKPIAKLDKKSRKLLKRVEELPTHGDIKDMLDAQKKTEAKQRLWDSLSPRKKLKVLRHLANRKGENG